MTVSTPSLLQAIQNPVNDQLELVSEEIKRLVIADVPLLAQVGDHLMMMRGKMFRPTLTLLCGEISGVDRERAVGLAAVVELVHLATLVHDDAVDHSLLRRGMPTLNAIFSHQVSVITGDYLYSRALMQLVTAKEYAALQLLVDAATRMTIGEMWQLSAKLPLTSTEEDYDRVIRAKTASLIQAACRTGALGEDHAKYDATLSSYGDALGMAFQIADDLIDYTEVAATTGKPTGLDLREHKVTLPLIHSYAAMPPQHKKTVENFFASTVDHTDEEVAEIVALVADHGGLEYARRRGEEFAREAEVSLRPIPSSVAKDSLLSTISYVMERNS